MMRVRDDILATLDAYAEHYCAKDLDGLLSLFVEGDDITVIGTAADERCVGRAEIEQLFRRNFSSATAQQFDWHWRHVTVAGNGAVVAADLTIELLTAAGPMSVPLRWTVALTHQNGQWRWLHRHASAAAASKKGTSYPGRDTSVSNQENR
jgi:ketosteroid isomerase-like protein